jgi:hypothetical protein
MFIHTYIVHGAALELQRWGWVVVTYCVAQKLKTFTIWLFSEKVY